MSTLKSQTNQAMNKDADKKKLEFVDQKASNGLVDHDQANNCSKIKDQNVNGVQKLIELPSLKELNNVLGQDSSSDDMSQDDMSELVQENCKNEEISENSQLPQKRKHYELENGNDVKVTQHLILRKRDIKGNYKAKFNIEKLVIEHEMKQIQLKELNQKHDKLQEELNELRDDIGKKVQTTDQIDAKGQAKKMTHLDFLMKEMAWMAEDFEREHKKKVGDLKKNSRACRKQIHEKKLKKEKEQKDMKIDLRRKAQNMSKMVQLYWKSVEKVVKHNYNVMYEKKRSQIRAKKLESFVSKHLKLSVKVAEELNTKQFMDQSMNKNDQKLLGNVAEESKKIYKIIDLQDDKIINEIQGENPTKRRKINDQTDQEVTNTEQQQDNQQQDPDSQNNNMTFIAEKTVEMAKSFQPTGFTLSSVQVKTKVPFLLHGSLREYQIIGLDWLVTLHNKKLNGILADEMGLGKTIQTISLLASLACDKGIWGPHLIVVPTTIIMNWEMEFKKWCPAFKILTYFGSQKERKMKRHGWSKDNSFHVCITSYKLVIQDHFAFRRKKWYYMVLDEAQNIKNFKSQRWQTLLRFNTKRRLLLTGTPLQNDVMELWSLMHFLMPNIFSSQQDFKEWFSNPFNQSINQNQSLNISVVQKLQSILRPFLLRRMKRDVEKQLPEKIEHIVQCHLSRRQRLLYDEYINSDKTKTTLQDSDFFSIMNVLMQLRKVCNHPDLFEQRTIESPFIMCQDRIKFNYSTLLYKAFQDNPLININYQSLNFILSEFESISQTEYQKMQELYPQRPLIQVLGDQKNNIDSMSEELMTCRPMADGFSQGKKIPVNCNVLAKQNTKNLYHTIPQIFPPQYDQQINNANSNMFYDKTVKIPNYLNTACLPFVQEYYSIPNFDKIRYPQQQQTNNKGFEGNSYNHILQSEEMSQYLMKYAQKLIQWKDIDQRNRLNILFRRPVYGDDCKKAIKINLLFNDAFELKRHKNLDRFTKNIDNSKSNKSIFNDLSSAPSTVFNLFALSQEKSMKQVRNLVDNWPEQTEEQIEIYNMQNILIKEIPISQQVKRKKKQQQMQIVSQQKKEEKGLQDQQLQKSLLLSQQQQSAILQFQYKYETVKYIEKQYSLIINKSALSIFDNINSKSQDSSQPSPLTMIQTNVNSEQSNSNLSSSIKQELNIQKSDNNDQNMKDNDFVEQNDQLTKNGEQVEIQGDIKWSNPNVQLLIEEIIKERVEEIKLPLSSQKIGNEIQSDQKLNQESNQQFEFKKQGINNEEKKQVNGKLAEKEKEIDSDENEQQQSPYSKKYQNASKRYVLKEQELQLKQQQSQQELQNQEDEHLENNEQNIEMKDEQIVQNENLSQNVLNTDIIVNNIEENKDSQQQQIEIITEEQQINTIQNNDIEQQEQSSLNDKENILCSNTYNITYKNCESLRDMIITPLQRVSILEEQIKQFKFIIPKVVAFTPEFIPTQIVTQDQKEKAYERFAYQKLMSHRNVNQSLKYSNILFFPHKNLIQYDCGKLQKLAQLLKQLYQNGHKVLLFTQMTRILDILESFLNLHGYTYVRLDGSVKVEMRQRIVDKFNLNKKIFCFISSTRCGGIGINLTGADCVIFYDTDWNPAMDKQAQDRCHRIGQTAKQVNIYRLISTNTIEENIFKKSLQKRELGGLIIEGGFDMDFFKKISIKDMISDENFFKPKRFDVMKDENIVFHLTGDQNMLGNQEENMESGSNNQLNQQQTESDIEKLKQKEQLRRKFEEALLRVEDQEDALAAQNAKREIDDEFQEEQMINGENGSINPGKEDTNNNNMEEQEQIEGEEEKVNEDQIGQIQTSQQKQDIRGAQQLQKEMKKNELIDWRNHDNLNRVTKQCIEYFEENYKFDMYLDDRSKKDNKFVNLLTENNENGDQENSQLKNKNKNNENKTKEGATTDDQSDFSGFSEEEDEGANSNNDEQMVETWDIKTAESFYKVARGEIEEQFQIV